MFEDLPDEVFENILVYLQPKDVCSVEGLCKRFLPATNSDVVWGEMLKRVWGENKGDNNTAKGIYKYYHEKYPSMSYCYSRLKRSWNTLKDWLKFNSPAIYSTLKKQTLDYDTIKSKMLYDAPVDLMCSLLIQDGQNFKDNLSTGLFGGYCFYHNLVDFLLFDLSSISSFTHAARGRLRENLIIIGGTSQLSIRIVVIPNDTSNFKKGQVALSWNNNLYVIANSYLEFFEEYVDNLAVKRIYDINGGRLSGSINRFPNCAELGSDTTTKGVRIRCNSVFIPWHSDREYFFAYRIRITMDKNEDVGKSCKLQSRHWLVRDEKGGTDVVDGEGVIGEFPTVTPGSYFEYCSCSSLKTRTGGMSGWFTMRSLQGGSEFNALINEFPLNVNIHF